jgi:putative transcriptional regulator
MKGRLAAICLLAWASVAASQPPQPAQGSQGPNGVFLVAKPELADPNFARTVVLVTQTEDYSTVGVIINRPTVIKLSEFVADPRIETAKYTDRLYLGGPVMRNALIAVFQSDTRPSAPAFHVLRKLYMTMHPDNVTMLLSAGDRRYRLYAGFSGWAPRQLESEFDREGWYVLPADEDILFRTDTSGLWEEMIQRVRALKTRAPTLPRDFRTPQMSGPAGGGAVSPG